MNLTDSDVCEDARELMREERLIARRHIGQFPVLAVVWGLLNPMCWFMLWPLVFSGVMPIGLAFPLATLSLLLSYLPSHEAQHSIIAMPGERLRWLNELVGTLSSIPIVIPYRVLRATHMEHHKYANDPERDPDYGLHADSVWGAIGAGIEFRQPRPYGRLPAYVTTLQRLGRKDLMIELLLYELVYLTVLVGGAWSGYAVEVALLWWLPRILAASYLYFFLAWAPHNPGRGCGRYSDTRAFRSRLGNIASMGMQYHIVHHLHPRIPLYRTPRAYWEMRPILERLGADVGELDGR